MRISLFLLVCIALVIAGCSKRDVHDDPNTRGERLPDYAHFFHSPQRWYDDRLPPQLLSIGASSAHLPKKQVLHFIPLFDQPSGETVVIVHEDADGRILEAIVFENVLLEDRNIEDYRQIRFKDRAEEGGEDFQIKYRTHRRDQRKWTLFNVDMILP